LSPLKDAATKAASELQLIARAQQGDEAAFEELFNAHKRRVYSLCLRMTGDPAEAEDLAQEAFLQLFRKIGTFRGESAFSTWLHRLVVNVVLMHLRKKGLQQISLDDVDTSQEEPVRREYGDEDRRLVGSVDRVSLERAIAQLPPGYRAVFVLHDIEGYEHNEIAQIMSYSIGNSKSQLHKARLRLRESLRQQSRAGEGNALLPAHEGSHTASEGKK
jgi:RNA polymerase sigma-70 factor, ECF subfamily